MRLLWVTLAIIVLAATASGQAPSPDIRVIDDKVSVQASAVPLGRLLRLLDFATGMTSKVPPELADRAVSVQFADLDLNAAVQKIFQGQMLDFVYVDGQGILVTASSRVVPSTPGSASPTPFPRDPSPFEPVPDFPQEPQQFIQDPVANPGGGIPGQQNPFGNGIQQQLGNGIQQPAVIQTPFGPIPNPRANQQAQPNAPLSGGGANPFGGINPFGGATPFGALPPNPFGSTPNTAGPPQASPGAAPITPVTTMPLVPNQQPKP